MIALTILIGILTFIAYSILYLYSNVKKLEGALANYNDMFTRQEKVNTAFNSINMAIIDQVKANNEFIRRRMGCKRLTLIENILTNGIRTCFTY